MTSIHNRPLVRIVSCGDLGADCMIPGRAGSTPSDMAGGPSMMMLIHKIWIAVNGVAKPNNGAHNRVSMAPMLVEKLKTHELDDVVVYGATFLHRADDAGEVVVREHQCGGFFRYLGAGNAHRHADVGGFQCGGVVDAIAGHGDDVPLRLQGFDDAHLVLRRHAGKHGAACDQSGHFCLRQPIQFASFVNLAHQPQFSGNGSGGRAVVSGDHFDGNASLAADCNRRLCLGSRRVDDADQTDHGQSGCPLQQIACRVERIGRDAAPGNRQHAQCIFGHGGIFSFETLADSGIQRRYAGIAMPIDNPRQQYVRRTFDPHLHPVVVVMKSRHELVGRIERDLGNARVTCRNILGVGSGSCRQCQQRALGRVADYPAIAEPGVGAQHGRISQRQQCLQVGGSIVNGKTVPGKKYTARRHPVERERAGSCPSRLPWYSPVFRPPRAS